MVAPDGVANDLAKPQLEPDLTCNVQVVTLIEEQIVVAVAENVAFPVEASLTELFENAAFEKVENSAAIAVPQKQNKTATDRVMVNSLDLRILEEPPFYLMDSIICNTSSVDIEPIIS